MRIGVAGAELFLADRLRDRHAEANSRLLKFRRNGERRL
jgi:hypothetical protein